MPLSQRKYCSGKSVGAIIKKGKKILLLDRAFFPFGWAGPAGHIEKNETPTQALVREVKEETGLTISDFKLILQRKKVLNECKKGTKFHDWWIFECKCRGKIKRNKKESKDIDWFLPREIKKLKLEPLARRWFKELKII